MRCCNHWVSIVCPSVNFSHFNLLWNTGPNEQNFARSIYVRSLKFPHFVPNGQQAWPPRAILNSDWLNFQKSSPQKPLGQMGTKLYRKHLLEVLYKVSSFHHDCTTNMVAMGNSCFWLADMLFFKCFWLMSITIIDGRSPHTDCKSKNFHNLEPLVRNLTFTRSKQIIAKLHHWYAYF